MVCDVILVCVHVRSVILIRELAGVLGRNRSLKKHEKNTQTFSVGPTELGLRGNQEFLTLILNPNTAVFLSCNS